MNDSESQRIEQFTKRFWQILASSDSEFYSILTKIQLNSIKIKLIAEQKICANWNVPFDEWQKQPIFPNVIASISEHWTVVKY